MAVEAVGELAEGVGYIAEGADGLGAHLGDYGGIDVGGGVTDFHLNEFDGVIKALTDGVTRTRGRIAAHGK